jgi:hypothetical protein
MPAAVGTNFNRAIGTIVSAADFAAGFAWVAFNLELSSGQVGLITALDVTISVIGADYNNLQFTQAFIFKGLNMNPGIPANSQLVAGTETLYNSFTAFLSERVFRREWIDPFRLEGPGRYCVFGQAFFGAFVGPASYGMNVLGRIAPAAGGPEFPLVAR